MVLSLWNHPRFPKTYPKDCIMRLLNIRSSGGVKITSKANQKIKCF